MSASGLDVFDKTLQTTHIWLNDLMAEEAIGPDRQTAWHVLGATLRTVRNRVPLDLAAHLGAQLPLLVRGAYYDQFRPSGLPERWRSLDEFLHRLGAELAVMRPVNTRDAARAVFDVLSRHVDPGQLLKIREALPEEVRALWPAEPALDTRVQVERASLGAGDTAEGGGRF